MSRSDENVITTNDRILERALTNTYNAVVATTGFDDQPGPPQALTAAKTRLGFNLDLYISHLEITIIVPENRDAELHRTLYIRFNAASFCECHFSPISQEKYRSVAPINEKIALDDTFYELVISYDDKLLYAENVFTELYPFYAINLRDYLRRYIIILVLVRGST